jgi:hypothetical protein
MSLQTTITTRVTADRRLEYVAHVIDRRTFDRREPDRLVARGYDETMAGLLAKLSARGYPMPEGVRS